MRFSRSLAWAWPVLIAAAPLAAQQAVRSPHGEMRRSIDCDACHTAAGWSVLRKPLAFSHARDAGFPLEGRHAGLTCEACHIGARFSEPRATAGDCAVCHVDVHQGGLGGECVDCHEAGGWGGAASLRAHARTNFPLTGAHLRVACIACHRDDRTGAFTRLDPSCDVCHAPDYERASFPDHQALDYATDCRACHGTASWHGALFDHTSTGFLLLGVHASIACANCHVPPDHQVVFQAAGPEDCVACHQADYDAEHGGSGYPTTCTMCHAPTSWEDASFDHDGQFFPIYSGRHREAWSTCLDCHPTPQNLAVFTCLTCHQRTETDSHHQEESGYVYESSACLACHPKGEADD